MRNLTYLLFAGTLLACNSENKQTAGNRKQYSCRNTPDAERIGYKGNVKSVEIIETEGWYDKGTWVQDSTNMVERRILQFDKEGYLVDITTKHYSISGAYTLVAKTSRTEAYDILTTYENNMVISIDTNHWLSDTETIRRCYSIENDSPVLTNQNHFWTKNNCMRKKTILTTYNEGKVESTDSVLGFAPGEEALVEKHGQLSYLYNTPGIEVLKEEKNGNPSRVLHLAQLKILTIYKYQYY